jgi:hydrogenase nickel incorporation protein HypA/HybF
MHELGIADGILAVAVDVADGERADRVRVRVGALHRVTEESLRFSFDLVTRDTPAANAQLELTVVGARVRCRRCATESAVDAEALSCRACESFDVEVVAGAELVVDAVRVAGTWRRRPNADRAAVEAG